MMKQTRFDELVARLHELTATNAKSQYSSDNKSWVTGEKFSVAATGATLDELREVGQAYGLYLHHCSCCDTWYFAWFRTTEEAQRYELSLR